MSTSVGMTPGLSITDQIALLQLLETAGKNGGISGSDFQALMMELEGAQLPRQDISGTEQGVVGLDSTSISTASLSPQMIALLQPSSGTVPGAGSEGYGTQQPTTGTTTTGTTTTGTTTDTAATTETGDTAEASDSTDSSDASETPTAPAGSADAKAADAMSRYQQADPAGYQKFMRDLTSGDGNAAAKDLASAKGKISSEDMATITGDIQKTANEHGGGKLSKEAKQILKDANDGQDLVHGGQTRAGHGAAEFFGSMVGVTQSKDKIERNHGTTGDLVNVSAATTQKSMTDAMTEFANVSPDLAQQFQTDFESGDGNKMAQDLIDASKAGLSSESVGALAGQIQQQANAKGSGRVNDDLKSQIQDICGFDAVTKGEGRGQLALDKVGNFFKSLTSVGGNLVGDVVGIGDDIASGQTQYLKGDLKSFAIDGVVAGLSVLPFVGPELGVAAKAGEAAAGTLVKGGAEAAVSTGVKGAIEGGAKEGIEGAAKKGAADAAESAGSKWSYSGIKSGIKDSMPGVSDILKGNVKEGTKQFLESKAPNVLRILEGDIKGGGKGVLDSQFSATKAALNGEKVDKLALLKEWQMAGWIGVSFAGE